jgi:serine/threonine protein kinase/DNA-binding CsgD family transcriptional regulator
MNAPLSPEAAGPPPRLQDRYRLVEQLGKGGMGLVFRARDEMLDRDVAIKFLAPERVSGAEVSARFLREARAVARLSHPHIMTLYDAGHEGGWHYLVLEHIAGKNLLTLLVERGGPLPVREALHAIRGALQALAYAHAHGIVHRDIKPENIMVTPEGQVKVTDFGLALAQGDVRLTQEGLIVGSVLYLAPELARGQPADLRSDLYAVGAVLYELLIGQPPFTGDDPLAILNQILHSPVTPPRNLDPNLSPTVEVLILKLLSKNPADRCASADEALAALPESVEAESVTTAPAEPLPPDRASHSLLESIVRGSSSAHRTPETPDEEMLLALPPGAGAAPLQQELLLYAALEDTTAAVEAERKRLAGLLQVRVIESLSLLLSQANVYEQTLGANQAARLAVSVLSSLARQALQQIRDLEMTLHPTLLESLGLEPALESLASQMMRSHGAQIGLALEPLRVRERLPAPIELALFRTAQEALEHALEHGHASLVTLRLERREGRLTFSLSDNGMGGPGGEALRDARQRIEQLGGAFEARASPQGGLELVIRFQIEAPAQLTSRELEVLQLLAEGLSNKEIARALVITPRTVNFHLDNVYSKLGVKSRTEAAIYALRHGLIRRSLPRLGTTR